MRRYTLGVMTGLIFVTAIAAAQPFPTSVQLAVNQLTTGVTPFSVIRAVANGYLNFGATSGVNGYGLRDNSGTIQFKQSGGSWVSLPASGTFPTDAPYVTQTADADLPNAFALGFLPTALLVNTTTTGVPTAYAGTTCTNQFPRSLSAIGAATCASVSLSADVTGTVGVGNGGTGLTAGTSGGILGFTASGTLASSTALTANALILGGGTGATPSALGSLGTTTTLLHGNAAGAPTFGAVVLTTDVSGILPATNGGTGNGFFAISGPASSTKTFTFPNATATVLTDNVAVTAAQGGTGQSSYTTGDLLYASAGTTLSKLADASTGNALIAGGVGVAPSYGKIGLTTHVSGTLAATNGGTGFASYTTGDLIYANSSTSLARLADVAVGSVLVAGGVGTAPAWSTGPQVASLKLGANLLLSSTAPTVGSGFGTSPVITGTASSFRINVGTGGTATDGVLTLPTATTGWNCHVDNLTATAANRGDQRTVQTASTTTSVTIQNQTISTGVALAWTASDVVSGLCAAY